MIDAVVSLRALRTRLLARAVAWRLVRPLAGRAVLFALPFAGFFVALFAALFATPGVQAQPVAASDISVQVARDGNAYTVTAEWAVPASVDEVWDVLTDFEHMATFLSSVDQSRVTGRDSNRVEITQKSHGMAGPIRISTDSVRQAELNPKREIRTHLLKGDLKASDFVTHIAAQGELTRISVSGKFVAGMLAGSAITPEAVQAQTQLQYQELREEILRRKARQPTPPCLLAKNCSRG